MIDDNGRHEMEQLPNLFKFGYRTTMKLLSRRTIMAAFVSLSASLTFLPVSQAFAAPAKATAPASQPSAPATWLILGDSLSAEYGLKRGSGWVALLEAQLKKDNRAVQVFNASISGETTAGGKTRLPSLLVKLQPKVVVIELGGNDALRGLDTAATEANLAFMISESQKIKAKVLLIGMKLPPNFGTQYGNQFEAMFKKLAKNGVALVPFFLEGFGEDLNYFQADRIHPTQAAQPKMLANVWPALTKLAKE
jgi:acyl-CoA thioesterase I